MVRFEWDEEKARENILEHRISFERATEVFSDPNRYTELDGRYEYGEERLTTIGMALNLLLLVVAYTHRGDDGEVVRIITARKANPRERRRYGNRELHAGRT